MSEIRTDPKSAAQVTAAFTQMVMQQTNMTLMLLGKIANPATGQMMRDLPAAQYFIEQLEMIQAKTQGNLTPEEAGLLKQSLMSLRLAVVEAVDAPAAPTSVPPAA